MTVLPESLNSIFEKRNTSYKMALVLSLLEVMDEDGQALYNEVRDKFRDIYGSRDARQLITHKTPKGIKSWDSATNAQIHDVMESPILALGSILEDYKVSETNERYIGFKPAIWQRMPTVIQEHLREYAEVEFRKEMNKLWAETYFSMEATYVHILDRYLEAKQQPRGGHPLAAFVTQQIPTSLQSLPFIQDRYVVQGSVGKPAWVKNPWIAIMDKRVTPHTRDKYYICYVFSEKMDGFYLTLKHSIPQRSISNVNFEDIRRKVEEIRDHIIFERFETDDLVEWSEVGRETNYLAGVIAYKKYDRQNMPDDEELFSDLVEMLKHYKQYADHELGITEDPNEEEADEMDNTQIADEHVAHFVAQIETYIQSHGFTYPEHLIQNFYLSLKTKPFVILAGISGTGKTKLVKLFAEAVGATRENGQFNLIPVRPDWNDPSDLLGYTALSGEFRPGKLTEVLMEASKIENRSRPYFICLDEMNLARVEHYFSDLLSLLETQEWSEGRIVTDRVIPLASLCEEDRATYRELCIPQNVYFVGTVNMDETTHPFSKKVLDRANTLEFNYIDLNTWEDLREIPSEAKPVEVDQSFLRSDYLTLKDASEHQDLIRSTTEKLTTVNQVLEDIHSHVGFRVRDAICFFMIYQQRFGLLTEEAAFDIQLTQKILPRIQGSNNSVKRALIKLYHFTKTGQTSVSENEVYDASALYKPLELRNGFDEFLYPMSARKIAFMLRRFEDDGFTSFWLS